MKPVLLLVASAAGLLLGSPALFSSPGTLRTLTRQDASAQSADRSLVQRVDFDADGLEDLSIVHTDGRLALFRRGWDDTLAPADDVLGGARLPRVLRAFWRDADGDGDVELFVLGVDGTALYFRNDAGAFTLANGEAGLPAEGIVDAVWVDADADGDADLVTVSRTGTHVHENVGGVFTTRVLEDGGATRAGERVTSTPGAPDAGLETTRATPEEVPAEAGGLSERTSGSPEGGLRTRRVPRGLAGALGETAERSSSAEPLQTQPLCLRSIEDQSGAGCIRAGREPVLGQLFPLGVDLFVESARRRVGIGTLAPIARLDVAPQLDETGIHAAAIGDASAGVFSTTSQASPAISALSNAVAARLQGNVLVADAGLAPTNPHTFIGAVNGGSQMWLMKNGLPKVEVFAANGATDGALMQMRNHNGLDTFVFDADNTTSSAEIEMRQPNGTTTLELRGGGAGTSGGETVLRTSDGTRTVRLESQVTPNEGAQLELGLLDGTTTAVLDGHAGSTGGALRLYDKIGTQTVRLRSEVGTDGGAEFSLSAWGGVDTVEIDAQEDGRVTGGGALLRLSRSNGAESILLDAQDTEGGAKLGLRSSSALETVEIVSQETPNEGAKLRMEDLAGVTTFVADAEAGQGSRLLMRTSGGQETFEVVSEEHPQSGSQLVMRKADGTVAMQVDADSPTSTTMSLYDYSGNETIEIASATAAGGGRMILRDVNGNNAIVLDTDLNGSSRVSVDVVEIQGADLVEDFDTGGFECAPGTVMSIDPKIPGELAPSSTPYDARVAGVVSGAGDVRAGLRLGKGGPLGGDTPVALTGRVYVRCSTENGAIEPGDLLTTSSTSGVAMRASDPTRAFGAILGKALGTFDEEEGEGLVLVLVSLQ